MYSKVGCRCVERKLKKQLLDKFEEGGICPALGELIIGICDQPEYSWGPERGGWYQVYEWPRYRGLTSNSHKLLKVE